MTTTLAIKPGDVVTVEETRGWATSTPTSRVVEGVARIDDEGTLRVGDVNIAADAEGYFPRGVVVLSIQKA